MVFSVIPRSAVTQAVIKMNSPKNVWSGMYEARRCEARPGNRNVTMPANH